MKKIVRIYQLLKDISAWGTIPVADVCINHGQFFLSHKKCTELSEYKTEKINAFFKNNISLSDIILNFEEGLPPIDKPPIFFCWWQGKDQMPLIPQLCYKKILQNANGHPVVFISKDNYQDYIEFPQYVKERFAEGNISITHLSDIIRLLLLAKYGGIWLDSTILLTKKLDEKIFSSPWWSIKLEKPIGFYVSKCRWTGFCISSTKNSPLLQFTSQFLCQYWKNQHQLIDFFLIDYIINYAYEVNSKFREWINNVPASNPDIYAMTPLLMQDYHQEMNQELFPNTTIFKLNRHLYPDEFLRQKSNTLFWHLYQE